jgi:hypothetical protein
MLAVFFIADGRSDPFYLRFTSQRQSSLIIGTSRAAQGLQPAVFNKIFYKNTGRQFYNYSFSLLDSPFGFAYYESIKKKLNPDTRDGIFVISVDPWSISSETKNPNDSADFAENKNFIGKTEYVNFDPNIPYLVQSYSEPYINILLKRKKKTALYLHEDGWLEVEVPMDSTAVAKNLEVKLAFYRKNYLPLYKLSSVRLNYLTKTIDFLQQHGRVYLVRLPVHKSMFEIENELMPGFDVKIDSIAKIKNVPYLNFRELKNEYQYVDGHHLYKTSGKEISALIAGWILQTQVSLK